MIFLFLCFVDISRASTIPSIPDISTLDSNQDDSTSLNYNSENDITIDDNPSPTNIICFTNKYKKYFSTQQTQSHQDIRVEENIHKCFTGDQCFTRKNNLNKHERLYTSKKPYKCSTCDKCFRQKSHLTEHQRLHTGEKPYKCSKCDKCFTHKSNLTEHIKVI